MQAKWQVTRVATVYITVAILAQGTIRSDAPAQGLIRGFDSHCGRSRWSLQVGPAGGGFLQAGVRGRVVVPAQVGRVVVPAQVGRSPAGGPFPQLGVPAGGRSCRWALARIFHHFCYLVLLILLMF